MDMNACHLSEKTLAALEAATKEDLFFSWDLFWEGVLMVDGMNATFVVWKFDGVLCQNAKNILERNSCFLLIYQKFLKLPMKVLLSFSEPPKSHDTIPFVNSYLKNLGPLRDIPLKDMLDRRDFSSFGFSTLFSQHLRNSPVRDPRLHSVSNRKLRQLRHRIGCFPDISGWSTTSTTNFTCLTTSTEPRVRSRWIHWWKILGNLGLVLGTMGSKNLRRKNHPFMKTGKCISAMDHMGKVMNFWYLNCSKKSSIPGTIVMLVTVFSYKWIMG